MDSIKIWKYRVGKTQYLKYLLHYFPLKYTDKYKMELWFLPMGYRNKIILTLLQLIAFFQHRYFFHCYYIITAADSALIQIYPIFIVIHRNCKFFIYQWMNTSQQSLLMVTKQPNGYQIIIDCPSYFEYICSQLQIYKISHKKYLIFTRWKRIIFYKTHISNYELKTLKSWKRIFNLCKNLNKI